MCVFCRIICSYDRHSLILFASTVLSLRARKKWSSAWSVAVAIISSKGNSIAWVNALNLPIASFVRSHKRYRCILFDWKAVEAINQIIIIIIIVTKAKKNIMLWPNEKLLKRKGFLRSPEKSNSFRKKEMKFDSNDEMEESWGMWKFC